MLRRPRAVILLVPAGPPVDSVINDLLAHVQPGDLIIDAVQGHRCARKMVHNGIEYGVMQLIAETYDLMKRGLGLNDDEMHEVYALWNRGELNGYLVEITSHIFSKQDEKTGNRLIDEILDVARQKGTGMWTSQSAMELQVPIPTIDLAVAMRDLSVFAKEREQVGAIYQRSIRRFAGDRNTFLTQLGRALYAARVITYAQGMAVLTAASNKYEYHFDCEAVARIWRGGCIIRAALLEDLCAAFHAWPDCCSLSACRTR